MVTLRVDPDNRWSLQGVDPENIGTLHFSVFFMEIDSKLLLASTWTKGGKHYTPPWTTGGYTPRCTGQQVVTLFAAPDNGLSHSLPTASAQRALKAHYLLTV